MTTDGGVTARAAEIGGRGDRWEHLVIVTLTWTSAVAVVVVLVLVDLGGSRWLNLVAGLAYAAVAVLIGWFALRAAGRERADTERLRRSGRPATAEVLGLELIKLDEDSAEVTAVLTLRISGAEVPPFDAVFSLIHAPWLREGLHLRATVDPSDNLFTLRSLPLA